MIAFVACSKSKLPYPCEAQKIYTPSAIFNKRMTYARSHADKIYILSAKYGLLKPNDWIEPYDCYLGDSGKTYKLDWAKKVLAQMKAEGIDFNEETYFAAGVEYWKNLASHFRNVRVESTEVQKALGRGE